MSLKSVLCKDLELKYPVFQGAMANISNADLAAAVSNAGGLGVIYSSGTDAAGVAAEIERCKKLTDKPFGVNLMLQNQHIDEIVQVVINSGVKMVATGAGNPEPYMPALIEAGIKVIPVIPNVRAAKKMEKLGAYAVVAEGTESGGHVGEMTTLALVPQVIKAVNIPVIAAGGIADGKSMAAMMLLGAAGVQMGTIFLTADECPVAEIYKEKILAAADVDTIVTGRGTPHVVRALKTPMSLRYAELEKQPGNEKELETLSIGASRRAVQGDLEGGCYMAGQISGIIDRRGTCAEIIERIVAEAEETIKNAASLLD